TVNPPKVTVNPPKSEPARPTSDENVRLNAFREKPSSEAAIIFVHGLFGDDSTTWTNPETKTFWPKLLTQDSAFDRFDIFTFRYETPKLKTAGQIDDAGAQLETLLKHHGLTKKNLVFVAHSMGGLVVRSMLLNSRSEELPKQTSMIAFYGA